MSIYLLRYKVYFVQHNIYFLLSLSSSYSDLMPQFLRAVRALCNLYYLYQQALQRSEITLVNPGARSVPTSPAVASSSDLPGVNVQRAGSFGSLLDGSSHGTHPTVLAGTTAVQPPTRRYHRRTRSQTLPPDETARALHPGDHNGGSPNGSATTGGRGGGRGVRRLVVEDPFTGLEAVWSSLESWFYLILAEVEKTTRDPAGCVERGRELLKRRMESIDATSGAKTDDNTAKTDAERLVGLSSEEIATVVVNHETTPPTVKKGEGGASKSRTGLKLSVPQSNQVAAAIVKTTPVERRMAYLG